jgi:hypothetical protein
MNTAQTLALYLGSFFFDLPGNIHKMFIAIRVLA